MNRRDFVKRFGALVPGFAGATTQALPTEPPKPGVVSTHPVVAHLDMATMTIQQKWLTSYSDGSVKLLDEKPAAT